MRQIGWLIPVSNGHMVTCVEHGTSEPNVSVPVYRENIYPYSQTCYVCGKTLVAGDINWPELFTVKENS